MRDARHRDRCITSALANVVSGRFAFNSGICREDDLFDVTVYKSFTQCIEAQLLGPNTINR